MTLTGMMTIALMTTIGILDSSSYLVKERSLYGDQIGTARDSEVILQMHSGIISFRKKGGSST